MLMDGRRSVCILTGLLLSFCFFPRQGAKKRSSNEYGCIFPRAFWEKKKRERNSYFPPNSHKFPAKEPSDVYHHMDDLENAWPQMQFSFIFHMKRVLRFCARKKDWMHLFWEALQITIPGKKQIWPAGSSPISGKNHTSAYLWTCMVRCSRCKSCYTFPWNSNKVLLHTQGQFN